ncbi:MAG: hypothetical protein AAB605_02710 [Patescibacteria group bacterium]
MDPNTQPPLGQVLLQETAVQPSQLSALFDPNSSLADFFSALFYTALAIGAILAVLRLGYAGFKYMTTDLFQQKQNAREIISQAVLGLLLLLSVWLILNQINPDILNLNILRSVKGQ